MLLLRECLYLTVVIIFNNTGRHDRHVSKYMDGVNTFRVAEYHMIDAPVQHPDPDFARPTALVKSTV